MQDYRTMDQWLYKYSCFIITPYHLPERISAIDSIIIIIIIIIMFSLVTGAYEGELGSLIIEFLDYKDQGCLAATDSIRRALVHACVHLPTLRQWEAWSLFANDIMMPSPDATAFSRKLLGGNGRIKQQAHWLLSVLSPLLQNCELFVALWDVLEFHYHIDGDYDVVWFNVCGVMRKAAVALYAARKKWSSMSFSIVAGMLGGMSLYSMSVKANERYEAAIRTICRGLGVGLVVENQVAACFRDNVFSRHFCRAGNVNGFALSAGFASTRQFVDLLRQVAETFLTHTRPDQFGGYTDHLGVQHWIGCLHIDNNNDVCRRAESRVAFHDKVAQQMGATAEQLRALRKQIHWLRMQLNAASDRIL